MFGGFLHTVCVEFWVTFIYCEGLLIHEVSVFLPGLLNCFAIQFDARNACYLFVLHSVTFLDRLRLEAYIAAVQTIAVVIRLVILFDRRHKFFHLNWSLYKCSHHGSSENRGALTRGRQHVSRCSAPILLTVFIEWIYRYLSKGFGLPMSFVWKEP